MDSDDKIHLRASAHGSILMFKTSLKVEIVGEQLFKLLEPLVYEDSDYLIEILPGFVFNGGSIPRLLWGLVDSPIGGIGSSAFCLHDICYGTQLIGKKEADDMLYANLVDAGMDRLKAYGIYGAVDLFGHDAYDAVTTDTQYWNFVSIDVK